jgi:Carboxypeptidase regulatory-like domain/TonB dependent receptor
MGMIAKKEEKYETNERIENKRKDSYVSFVSYLFVCFVFSLLPLTSGSLLAQPAMATLSGMVLDEHGAVIAGARITILNLDTARQRGASTNGEGYFAIPLLPPGRYILTAQCDGFVTMEVRDITLDAGANLAVRLQLKIGAIGEYVTIVESGAGVERSAALGAVINRRFIENLPLNGRSFQSLFELIPGTVLTKTTFDEQGQFSVNGQRANANYFTVDGLSANIGVTAGSAPGQAAGGSLPALTVFGGTNNLASLEALEEFRIQTSTFAPEFGRTAGAQISIITRSGTNQYRGSVFNYLRHEALDANDWFANREGFGRSSLRHNNFGGVLGGPIARDRTFFFLSYEGLQMRQPRIAVTDVPSLEARQKALPQIRPYLDAFPLPNGADLGNGFAEFAAAYSDPSSMNAGSLRLDQIINQKLILFARFNHASSNTRQRGSGIIPGFESQSLNTIGHTAFRTTTMTGGMTFMLAANVTNDLRANWSRASGFTSFALDRFGGAEPLPNEALFPLSVLATGAARDAGFQILFRGGANSSLGVGKHADNLQRQVNLIDTLSIIAGPHHIKLGADYRRLAPIYGPLKYNQSVVFGDSGSPAVFLAAATATAYEVQVTANADPRAPIFTNFSAFAQDTWQATPKLTITYGLRWDLNPPPSERSGNYPFAITGLDDPKSMELMPRGTPLWKTPYRNFAPRIGVAYQPFSGAYSQGGSVIRAGFGLFYDLGHDHAAQAFGNTFPYTAMKNLRNVQFPLDPIQAEPPPLSLDPPYGTIYGFDRNLNLPYTIQWNLTLEQPLGSNHTLSTSYVAAVGRHLLRKDLWIPSHPGLNNDLTLNPQFTRLYLTSNSATSDYHALQIQFQRRMSRGLQAHVAYTWSHSIDQASSGPVGNLRIGSTVIEQGRGPSDFDIRHSLVAAATYNLPAPNWRSWAGSILRNWTVNTIFRVRSAAPVNVSIGNDPLNLGLKNLLRPDLIPGVPLYIADPSAPGGRRINREAFRLPSILSPGMPQGTLPRNALRGFRASQIDLAISREFNVMERFRMQLRAESFNLLNQSNFGDPAGDLSSRFFGESTQMFGRSLGSGGINGGLSPLYQVGGPRSIQMALRLQF